LGGGTSGSERWQSKDSWQDEYGTLVIQRPARDNDGGCAAG
jgi:hypothetical protein